MAKRPKPHFADGLLDHDAHALRLLAPRAFGAARGNARLEAEVLEAAIHIVCGRTPPPISDHPRREVILTDLAELADWADRARAAH